MAHLLSIPFVQLPIAFDPSPLLESIQKIGPEHWSQHRLKNLRSIPLVEWTHGKPSWCSAIDLLPILKHILHAWDAPIGESRVSVLQPGAKVEEHVDIDYYWKHRFRVHLILQTNTDALFGCDGQVLSLPAGQVWVSNNWAPHWIANNGTSDRIHIVIDTLGSPLLQKWINDGWKSTSSTPQPMSDALGSLPHRENEKRPPLETFSKGTFRTVGEVQEIISDCLNDIAGLTHASELERCRTMLTMFSQEWRQIQQSPPAHSPAQQYRLQACLEGLLRNIPNPQLWNGLDLHTVLQVQIGTPLYRSPKP